MGLIEEIGRRDDNAECIIRWGWLTDCGALTCWTLNSVSFTTVVTHVLARNTAHIELWHEVTSARTYLLADVLIGQEPEPNTHPTLRSYAATITSDGAIGKAYLTPVRQATLSVSDFVSALRALHFTLDAYCLLSTLQTVNSISTDLQVCLVFWVEVRALVFTAWNIITNWQELDMFHDYFHLLYLRARHSVLICHHVLAATNWFRWHCTVVLQQQCDNAT